MQLVFFVAYVFEALIAYIYYSDAFKLKRSVPFTMITSLLLYLAGFGENYLFNNNWFINVSFFIVINIVFAILCFETKFITAFFYTIVLTIIMILTEYTSEFIIARLFKTSLNTYNQSINFLIIYAVTSKMFYLIVSKAISTLYNRKNKENNKSTYILFVYPITVTLLFVYIYNTSDSKVLSGAASVFLAVFCIVSLLFSCFIFIYNRHIQNQQQELFELQHQSLKNEIDMQYLDLLEKKNQQMQILTHDYKNHLAAIRELGDNEQVAEYIDKMTDEIKSSNSTSHSGNHTLDIIINKYVTECELKHISFSFDTKLSNLGFVDDFDLVTILGNALDNALEAAEKSTDKNITLSTKKVNTYDTVVITNSCDTAPDKNRKTKKQKGTHGLGLKSVEKTIKKYGGECEWEYNSDSKLFTITIMLLNKED